MKRSFSRRGLASVVLAFCLAPQALAQKAAQKNDEEYTRLIKQHLQDPRITTELVDHLPLSSTVPSPLKHFGHIMGQPGEIEYTKDLYITSGVTVERPSQLFVRGSILRGKWSDRKSPISYGYDASDLPVYFNQDPVLNVAGGGIPAEFAGFLGGGGPPNAGLGQIVTPMATPLRINPLDPEGAPSAPERPQVDEAAAFRSMAAAFGVNLDAAARPRVVLSFPTDPNDMLLSGSLTNGQFLSNRAAAVDVPLGKGHVVMFAIRPFWRWQTQGTFSLGFNAILNWNDLDAGKPVVPELGGRRR